MIPRKALIAVIASAAALAGCKSQGDIVIEQGVGITALRSVCPAVGVPDYLGDVTLFNPADARTADAIDVSASITNVRSQCDDSGDQVYSNATFDVVAQRRDTQGARTVELPYFSTVVRGSTAVIAKRVGTVTLQFADGQARAQASGTAGAYVDRAAATLPGDIRDRITRKRRSGEQDAAVDPLAQPDVRAAVARASFELLVGFQLTEDQLALLWRATPEPVLCFDGDKAGVRAAWRSLDLALPGLKPGRSVRYALLPEGKDPDDLVKAGGRDAFDTVLKSAKPLADMLWSRETAGRVFDTPERRAELEKLLREATNQIGDESVRRHYGQAMRERINAHFGAPQPGRGRQQGQGGRNYGRGGGRGAAGGRLAISESLTRSRLLSAAVDDMPLREAALVSTVLCHPDLLADHFDDFTALELDHSGLERLRSAILEACATGRPRSRAEVLEQPALAAHLATVGQLDALIRRARLWTATEDAAHEDALEGFRQALHLHRRARALRRELRAAETALGTDASDFNFGRLADIRREIDRTESLEALVDGFGVSSGRPTRSF